MTTMTAAQTNFRNMVAPLKKLDTASHAGPLPACLTPGGWHLPWRKPLQPRWQQNLDTN
jgi:hypothetical protein